jgi:hypothetical protein
MRVQAMRSVRSQVVEHERDYDGLPLLLGTYVFDGIKALLQAENHLKPL